MPRTRIKSPTRRKPPTPSRCATIRRAIAGPIPGSPSSSSTEARFTSTGAEEGDSPLVLTLSLTLSLALSLTLSLRIRWGISSGVFDPSAQQHSSSTTSEVD